MKTYIDFEKSDGFVPVIVQEYATKQVLMLGYMNKETLYLTLKTKYAHYYSRSRKAVWKKGEKSGHVQKVIDIRKDSDANTLLLIVEQVGKTTCHTGAQSYFFESFLDDTLQKVADEKVVIVSKAVLLPTKYGTFIVKAYKDGSQEHLVIMSQDLKKIDAPYLRIHSECLTGDVFESLKCDCGNQLAMALELIVKEGGILIYHRQEGRNIGLVNKINAYALQEIGYDTIEANLELGFRADERDYSIVGYILKELEINRVRLITNNPDKINYLTNAGITIIDRKPCITEINSYNENYVNCKTKAGHLF